MELTSRSEGYELPVGGQQVTRCCIDYSQVVILCQNLVEIAIGEPFVTTGPDGTKYGLDPSPQKDPVTLTPILYIMRKVIRIGIATYDGRLRLEFDDGSRLDVPPGTNYEAWTLAGPGGIDGLKVVSGPGGELAIWSDQSSNRPNS